MFKSDRSKNLMKIDNFNAWLLNFIIKILHLTKYIIFKFTMTPHSNRTESGENKQIRLGLWMSNSLSYTYISNVVLIYRSMCSVLSFGLASRQFDIQHSIPFSLVYYEIKWREPTRWAMAMWYLRYLAMHWYSMSFFH